MDAIAQFKDNQRQAWSTFAPTEIYTCAPAARLVAFARITSSQRVLDVGCGTGVVALAAARTGARITGLDLTPELIAHAKQNAAIAGAEAEWLVGDAEALPFEDGSFDAVVSQFGHMFAPRPDVALKEMLRVLKPGGTIAFATWPPDFFTGRVFQLVGKFLPPLPPGVSPPVQWGNPVIVRERLGTAVKDVVFDSGTMRAPYLSPQHVRAFMERSVGPVMKLTQMLQSEPAKLAEFRAAMDALSMTYFEPTENILRQDYLLTRAIK
ncbi:MAG: class I SAM-dependent methyltransferase [Myxococcota bacterium]|nr:class I SAM-dependent methyltransferase [Myxococcota bacterium]